MKDYCSQELKVGDQVIIIQPHYKNFINGQIIKITEKMALIEYEYQNRTRTVKQFFYQIIKKPYPEN